MVNYSTILPNCDKSAENSPNWGKGREMIGNRSGVVWLVKKIYGGAGGGAGSRGRGRKGEKFEKVRTCPKSVDIFRGGRLGCRRIEGDFRRFVDMI
jgi:hypothetical protein